MKNGRQIQVFVLIDALGWRYVRDGNFLAAELPYQMPLRTVLGFSSGAIPTILTGLEPARTGHWNLFYFDPENSPFRFLRPLRFLPDAIVDNRVTRKVMKELGRRVLGMGPMFECHVNPRLLPWFNFIERRNIYDRGSIQGAPSIFDQLAENGIDYRVYTYRQMTDSQILQQARRDMENTEASFFFLYLSEMDHFLHDHIAETDRIEAQLKWYGSELSSLFGYALSQDPNANLAIFSDHGMAPVRHHYDLVAEVEALGYRMPEDYLAVYDSTMARFWVFSDEARRDLVNVLETRECGRILPDEELEKLGVLFRDRRYGEIVFLLHPGWLLAKSDFNGAQWTPQGMHGYHPDDSDSDAIFLSNRRPDQALRTIADVHRCMREAVA